MVFLFKKWANRSFSLFDVSKSLRSLTKNERCERIAQVAHQKWAYEWITQYFEQIAHSIIFGQKTSDSLGKPMNEFPALVLDTFWHEFIALKSVKKSTFCSLGISSLKGKSGQSSTKSNKKSVLLIIIMWHCELRNITILVSWSS